MNHEDFVTYEQAKILKKLGFNWECNHYYDHNCKLVEYNMSYESCYHNWNDDNYKDFRQNSAPTLAQAQKWLRTVKCIIVHVFIDDDSNEPWSYELVSTKRDEDDDWVYLVTQWNSNFYGKEPEQALSAGIDKALELLKEKE